ncbi:MAG: hypothetical protein U0T69_04775 [Chitinophagales bacterium]
MEFKNALSRGGNAILPETIIVTDSDVTWKKRNKTLISSDSISISISAISSVEIDTSIVGTTIRIKSNGQGEIIGSNFTATDAKDIKRLISQSQNQFEKNDKVTHVVERNLVLETKQFEEDKYYDIDRIPLIEFSQDANVTITELNKIMGLYRVSLKNGENKKSEVYFNKINEGFRILDTSVLTSQQSRLAFLIKSDLHDITIKNYLIKGLTVSRNNMEKTKSILYFIFRNKWWVVIVSSFLYVMLRNFLSQD